MSAEILNVLGLGCLPFLGWLAIVAPLLITATAASGAAGPQARRDRRLLLKFFAVMLGLSLLALGAFLLVHLIGQGGL